MDDLDGSSSALPFQALAAPSISTSYDGDTNSSSSMIKTAASSEIAHLTHSNPTTIHKLKEANTKYKHLLKLAKERIQAQEDELELLRASAVSTSIVPPTHKTDAALSLTAALSIPLVAIDRSQQQQQQQQQGLVSVFLDILTLDYDTLPPINRIMDESSSSSYALGNNITCSIVKVCLRIQLQPDLLQTHPSPSSSSLVEEGNDFDPRISSWEEQPTTNIGGGSSKPLTDAVWALMEYEITVPDGLDTTSSSSSSCMSLLQTFFKQQQQQQQQQTFPSYRFQRWKRFTSNNQLLDHVRRDRGEPVFIPPFSLTPQQAMQVHVDAKRHVESITEEYRKFRVKAEIARKQAEETIRMLQHNQVQVTQDRFTAVATAAAATAAAGHTSSSLHLNQDLLYKDTHHSYQLQRLQNELSQQEIQWKKMYDDLLAENNKLKSSASEGLVASQWRHRYEQVCKERDDWRSKCEVYAVQSSFSSTAVGVENNNNNSAGHGNKGDINKEGGGDGYESKYRDLKESFRLYRKKAKEIFDAQQRGDGSGLALLSNNGASPSSSSDNNAKLIYLKNLMVNYLCADESSDVRGPMERAIGTVLQFNDADFTRISSKKSFMTSSSSHGPSSWFG